MKKALNDLHLSKPFQISTQYLGSCRFKTQSLEKKKTRITRTALAFDEVNLREGICARNYSDLLLKME
jgi:hypothetical protein